MKLFLDTANVEDIRRANDTGLLDGVTTNPSHLAKTGAPYRKTMEEICQIVSGPVSVEAIGAACDELVASAKEMVKIADNINVKIPMTVEGMKAVQKLEGNYGIRTNVTMIFSSSQAYLALKAGAMFVSIVLGRLDAIATDSEQLVLDSVKIKKNYGYSGEILTASLKNQHHVLWSLRAGAGIATVPADIFFQLYKHPLTDTGIEQFDRDWKTVPQ